MAADKKNSKLRFASQDSNLELLQGNIPSLIGKKNREETDE